MSKYLILFIGLLIALGITVATPFLRPIIADDVVQPRVNQALPILSDGVTLTQRFTPRHNGITQLTVQSARYDIPPAPGSITLALFDAQNNLVAEQRFDAPSLAENQFLTLDFPAQPTSKGQPYTLRVTGAGMHGVSLWGYTLETLGGDSTLTVEGVPTNARSLYLTTRYELLGGDALTFLASRTLTEGGYWLLAVAFITLPGVLLLNVQGFRVGRWRLPKMLPLDPAAWWGLAVALGLSAWALLWQWGSLAGLRWNGALLWAFFGVGWAVALFLWWRQRATRRTSGRGGWRAHATLITVLLLGFSVRLLAIRDLTIPPWIDSVRHALITTLMAEKGQVLTNYAPLLPIERFPYHFGFHTIPASLTLMSGWALPDMLLALGQLLNALAPLAVYTGAWLITRRRGVSVGAALLVALPFLFPAYYATWGRYTQLTGMLILPPLAGLMIRLIAGGRGWRHTWWWVALLAAGLFLAHIRVFLYLMPLPLVVWLWQRGRHTRALLAAGVLGGLLVLPRILYLMPRQRSPEVFLNNIPDYNTFPTGYFTAGWETFFAGAAIVAALLVILINARERRWSTPLLYIALWIGLLFGSLAGRRLGLPESWLVNLNSMVITLFFPQSLLLASVGGRLWGWGQHFLARVPPLRYASQLALAVGVGLTALFGMHFQTTVLNPQTVLSYPDDTPALAWVAQNTPTDAVFAVNSWRWLGNTWSGADGGAWLVPLVRRASKTPPADYEYNADLLREVVAFNETLNAQADWSDPAQVEWLKNQGATHIFIGTRGGSLDPAALVANPAVELLYHEGGAFVFRVR